ncbi:MAG TPA: hypothetical protein VGP55_15290 [Chitinophagaceae bacterium]|nr:hypothetical protein [Chitinophagaceae bacterium]
MKILEEKFSMEIDNVEKRKSNLDNQIKEIKRKIEFLNGKYLDEILSDKQFKEMISKLEEQQSDLIMKHATLKQMPTEYSRYIKYGCSLIGNLSDYFKDVPVSTKKRLIGSIFPEKIIFENGTYRTTKINSFFRLLSNSSKAFINNKTGISTGISCQAPPPRLERGTL